MIPTLVTERLTMRGWSEADFEGFASIYADEAHARHIGGACSGDDAWRRMAAVIGHWSLRGYGMWALEDRGTGAFVGWCGMWNPRGWPEREIGWALTSAATGRGLATEAAERARAYAYAGLGWATTISFISMQNASSIRVAERLGARLESTVPFRGDAYGIFRHPPASAFRFTA